MLIWLGDSDFSVSLFFRFVLEKSESGSIVGIWLDVKEVELVPSQAILIVGGFMDLGILSQVVTAAVVSIFAAIKSVIAVVKFFRK